MRNMKKSTAGVVIGVTVLLCACAGKSELPAVSEKNISDSSTSVVLPTKILVKKFLRACYLIRWHVSRKIHMMS